MKVDTLAFFRILKTDMSKPKKGNSMGFKSLAALVFLLTANTALAVPSSGTSVRLVLTTTSTIPAVTWTPIVSSSVKGIKGISIFNNAKQSTTPHAIEVGIALAGSAADSEVTQMVIPPSQSDVGVPGAVFYPLSTGYGVRISVRNTGTSGSILNAGEIDSTFFYN